MSNRLSITPGRMIVTKAGYDAADLNVADQNKVFDSNWGFTGLIIARGQITDPAPRYSSAEGDQYATATNASLTITFPTVGYAPAAYVFHEYTPRANSFQSQGIGEIRCTAPLGGYLNGKGGVPATIEDGIITIFRGPAVNGAYARWPGIIRYIVFAISQ